MRKLETESFEALSGESMPKFFPQTDEGQSMRWSRFKDKDDRDIYEIVGQKESGTHHELVNQGASTIECMSYKTTIELSAGGTHLKNWNFISK